MPLERVLEVYRGQMAGWTHLQFWTLVKTRQIFSRTFRRNFIGSQTLTLLNGEIGKSQVSIYILKPPHKHSIGFVFTMLKFISSNIFDTCESG